MKYEEKPKIKDEFEYEMAIAKVEELWNATPGSTDELVKTMLLDMIREYEGHVEVEVWNS